MGDHNWNLHPHLYPCTKCPQHYDTQPEQAAHLKTVHNVSDPWICSKCPEAFNDKKACNHHLFVVHPDTGELHPCGYCYIDFHYAKDEAHHTKYNHTEQDQRVLRKLERGCPIEGCQYTNESRVAYSVHVLHQHTAQCSIRNKKFQEREELVEHNRDGPCKINPPSLLSMNLPPTRGSYIAGSPNGNNSTQSNGQHQTQQQPEIAFSATLAADDGADADYNPTHSTSAAGEQTGGQTEQTGGQTEQTGGQTEQTGGQTEPTTPTIAPAMLSVHPSVNDLHQPSHTEEFVSQDSQAPERASSEQATTRDNELAQRPSDKPSHDESDDLLGPFELPGEDFYVWLAHSDPDPHQRLDMLAGLESLPGGLPYDDDSIQQQIDLFDNHVDALMRATAAFEARDVSPGAPEPFQAQQDPISDVRATIDDPLVQTEFEQGSSSTFDTLAQDTTSDHQHPAANQVRVSSFHIHDYEDDDPRDSTSEQTAAISDCLASTNAQHLQASQTIEQVDTFIADPPLPQSAKQMGYTDEDFNPKRVWKIRPSRMTRREQYNYPADLADKHIFNGNPEYIAGNNLIRLSKKYNTEVIFKNVNQHRNQKVIRENSVFTQRLKAALNWAVDDGDFSSLAAAKESLNAARISNNLKPRVDRADDIAKRKREDDSITQTAKDDEDVESFATPSKRAKIAETMLPTPVQSTLAQSQFTSTPSTPMMLAAMSMTPAQQRSPMQGNTPAQQPMHLTPAWSQFASTPPMPMMPNVMTGMSIQGYEPMQGTPPRYSTSSPAQTQYSMPTPTRPPSQLQGVLGRLYYGNDQNISLNNGVSNFSNVRVFHSMTMPTPAPRRQSGTSDLIREGGESIEEPEEE